MRTALFPGSFDPITCGHVEIVRRGLKIFDRIVVGVGVNTSKTPTFSVEKRVEWIEKCFENDARVEVRTYQGLTVHFARECGAEFILRGLRAAPDFEYEKNIDLLNNHLFPGVQTVYLIAFPETAHISSTLVREVVRFGGILDGLVPPHVVEDIVRMPR
ncbi:MAG: pantetheine-phosphate adenylyltransferase [Bacteroidia bacterium]|nr:pantetheine-phosphate adenylyltransferase [Bacteroidia bacterium]